MAYGEPDDDLDAFIAAVDRALTAQFGPDHQVVLSSGATVSSFDWSEGVPGGVTTLRTGPP